MRVPKGLERCAQIFGLWGLDFRNKFDSFQDIEIIDPKTRMRKSGGLAMIFRTTSQRGRSPLESGNDAEAES